MAAVTTVDDVDRSIVLSYATRIPWDKYVGYVGVLALLSAKSSDAAYTTLLTSSNSCSVSAGSASSSAALTGQDVALIKRLGVLSPSALAEALNNEAVSV